jgi:hypothetical protein
LPFAALFAEAEVLVDVAVAVVVNVVADLSVRDYLPDAAPPSSPRVAGLLTRDAGAFTCSAEGAGVAGLLLSSRTCGTAVEVLVGVAIAVVVDAVATLCLGIVIPTTDCCTVLADK